MSDLDERLERALHESAAPAGVDTSNVFGAVAHKRRRRQLRRRALASGLAASVVLGAGVTGVILTRDDGEDLRVATPGTPTTAPPTTLAPQPSDPEAARAQIQEAMPGAEVEFASDTLAVATPPDIAGETTTVLMAQLSDGSWQPAPTPLAFVHEGVLTTLGAPAFGGRPTAPEPMFPALEYVRGPLASDGTELGVTVEVPSATGSTLVRIGCDCGVTFEGQLLWIAPGADVWWAVTRDYQRDADGTEYRLKRIVDGQAESNPIPAGAVPAGAPVSDGSAVWVPTRDGVLRFDAATGEPDRELPLTSTSEQRGIALIQGEVVVTDGSRLVRTDGSEVVDTESAAPLVGLAATNNAVWAISATEAFGFTAHLADLEDRFDLPPGLSEVAVDATDDRVAVLGIGDLGLADPTQVVVLIQPDGSTDTVVVAGGADPAAAVVGDELVFTSGGRLFSVAIG